VRNIVRDSTVFIIIIFERGLLLEESILTKVCYGVSAEIDWRLREQWIDLAGF